MQSPQRPVRRATAVTKVPKISVVNGMVFVDAEDDRWFMPLDIASGYAARIAEKLAALAKLQSQ